MNKIILFLLKKASSQFKIDVKDLPNSIILTLEDGTNRKYRYRFQKI